jgi:hypothetical protein
MSPTIRLVSGGPEGEPEEVFVSIEHIPVVLADLRRSLPSLQKELKKKWPVEHVGLHERRPFRNNPYDPSQIVVPAAVGLVITFTYAAAKAAGAKIGDGVGKEIAELVHRWLRGKPKAKRRKRHKKNAK